MRTQGFASELSCDDVREMAGAFVLGALEPDEDIAVRAHLAACNDAHAEIFELASVLPALAQSVPLVEPPPGLKARIMAAAAAEYAADDARAADAVRGAAAGTTRAEEPTRIAGTAQPEIAGTPQPEIAGTAQPEIAEPTPAETPPPAVGTTRAAEPPPAVDTTRAAEPPPAVDTTRAAEPIAAVGTTRAAEPPPAVDTTRAAEPPPAVGTTRAAEPIAFPTAGERAARRSPVGAGSWLLRIAAVVAIVALGGWGLILNGQLDAARAFERNVAAVLDAAGEPGALTAVLSADGGSGSGLAAVRADGTVALAMRDLAPTSGASVYEAWVIGADGVPVAIGGFRVDGNGTGYFEASGVTPSSGIVLALTLEPGPGAKVPTGPVISKGVATAAS